MILLTPKINNMEQKLTYEQFVTQAMLHDQTHIVPLVLESKYIELDECFLNEYDTTVYLPEGEIIMPNSHYCALIDKNSAMRQELVRQYDEKKAAKEDTTDLKAEINQMDKYSKRFETIDNKARRIHEWRLIPHWLADRLFEKGETILRAYGCNWWGVKEIQPTGVSNHEVLKVIYNEL
jgi:hypothetical protein